MMTGQRSVSEMLGRLFACLSVCLLFLGLLLIQKARVTLHVRSRNPSFSPGKDRTYTWVFNKYLLNEWVKDKQYPSKLQRGGKTLGIICHEWERNHFTQSQIKVKNNIFSKHGDHSKFLRRKKKERCRRISQSLDSGSFLILYKG